MKAITGYEGCYAVTATGEVWSLPKMVPVGANGGMRVQPLRRLSATRGRSLGAHLRVYLAKEGRKRPFWVHQLVAQAYLPNPHGLPFVNHLDGNPANNHASNLEWCTPQRNAQHAFQLGLVALPPQSGERNSQAKLMESDVKLIRADHAAGQSCAAIARQFRVNPKTVNDIVHGKRWAHVL